jgi:hypothetical protein
MAIIKLTLTKRPIENRAPQSMHGYGMPCTYIQVFVCTKKNQQSISKCHLHEYTCREHTKITRFKKLGSYRTLHHQGDVRYPQILYDKASLQEF